MARALPPLRENLVSYREALGLSQADLARRIGVPASTINRYEKGPQMPTGVLLVAIAEVLGVTPKALLGGQAKNLPASVSSPRVGRPPKVDKDALAASMLEELDRQPSAPETAPPITPHRRSAKVGPE